MSTEKNVHSFAFLKNEFESAEKNYLKIESRAKSKVTHWVWASGPIYRLEPWDIERNGFKEGEVLTKEPKQKKNKYCYGKSKDESILVIRRGVGEDLFEDEFCFFDKNTITCYRYNSFKEPVNIKSRLVDHDRIKETLLVGEAGSRKEVFVYQGEQLIQIQVEEYDTFDSPVSSTYLANFDYDNKGLISIFYKFPNGFERYQFHR